MAKTGVRKNGVCVSKKTGKRIKAVNCSPKRKR